ncbi:hypothetical protein [Cryptosporidium parvum Iowa II]|uniref:Uncharacterized protein n=2 Tax=Cryptosporidium parvum TaxID=5807 RepID=Q5CTK5_CRYPI|nr:hypothetical protein [Cryptosporidium parvum Iowa II]EAK88740.1 hypothetical protein cgd2_2620 [Cryptosporidium parvum Iowa II]QOY42969.1 Uncharacterized protein CPATCC_0028170 [Cryptosporidium parvum]WKS76560.1 hypothetical protein CPCDC_2g2620 [Cryptosporidium sp. 43IA8]WRK31052.1 Uncharacterized protein cpbgf_2002620 [Cryptosporidium parvum]|eukprot:QOY42969.1 hypothetical protein CPATCC_000663 [Cryptosporidium parvum]
MKHFFSINRIFPNISIELKFSLNHIFDFIQDKHTHYRILNAIYILSIDLKDDNTLDPGAVINNFIKLIGRLLELEKYENHDELDLNISLVEIFLDTFFLIKFPKNCNLIELINSKMNELRVYNFWILGQLINELYRNSRESNYKFQESILTENRNIENNSDEKKDIIIEWDTLNAKFESIVKDFEDIDQIFEYKDSIKIGIPSYLDFDYDLNNSKRINFFYLDEGEVDVVYRIAAFSISLRNQILENLFKSLKNFQNKYQCNSLSILICRLIIYRHTEFENNIIEILNQLIENSRSEILVASLFECSLLIKDKELCDIFDFYSELENSCDFLDVVITINNLIRLHMESYSSSLSKFLPWIKTKRNDQILKLDKKLINMSFSDTFEMVNFYLDRFKSEFNLISKNLDILISIIRENIDEYCYDYTELVINEIKGLIFSTPIFDRNDLLEILCKFFSMNSDAYLGSTSYTNYDFASKKPVEETKYCSNNESSVASALYSTKLSRNNYSKSLLCNLWFRSIKIIQEIQNYNFQKELLIVLKTISKRQQFIFWWYITSNNAHYNFEFVSKLFTERRRIGTLQCYLTCMEIEFKSAFINNALKA